MTQLDHKSVDSFLFHHQDEDDGGFTHYAFSIFDEKREERKPVEREELPDLPQKESCPSVPKEIFVQVWIPVEKEIAQVPDEQELVVEPSKPIRCSDSNVAVIRPSTPPPAPQKTKSSHRNSNRKLKSWTKKLAAFFAGSASRKLRPESKNPLADHSEMSGRTRLTDCTAEF